MQTNRYSFQLIMVNHLYKSETKDGVKQNLEEHQSSNQLNQKLQDQL